MALPGAADSSTVRSYSRRSVSGMATGLLRVMASPRRESGPSILCSRPFSTKPEGRIQNATVNGSARSMSAVAGNATWVSTSRRAPWPALSLPNSGSPRMTRPCR